MSAPSESTAAPLVRLDGVGLRFGAHDILRDLRVDIPRGQTAAIIGESGCGKTVMLKLIIGLLRPTAGRSLFDEQEMIRLGERELVRQRLRFGFVFQAAALFDSLSVFDNVAFALRQHTSKTPDEIQQEVMQRLREVGLPPSAAVKKPAELSGGMRKRVGMARAVIMNPEIMLYDEPTTGLDPVMSDVIDQLILQTQRSRGATGIVVTHDMNTVRKVADRIIMLYPLGRLQPDEPQIIFDGTPEQLWHCDDPRVKQFVQGEGRDRLQELNGSRAATRPSSGPPRMEECIHE